MKRDNKAILLSKINRQGPDLNGNKGNLMLSIPAGPYKNTKSIILSVLMMSKVGIGIVLSYTEFVNMITQTKYTYCTENWSLSQHW